jgi:hypothetical protein
MKYLGIDPGQVTGVIAGFEDDSKIPIIIDAGSKEESEMYQSFKLMSSTKDFRCCIESQHSFPGQHAVHMWDFAQSYGVWLGILQSYPSSYSKITVFSWHKKMIQDLINKIPDDIEKDKRRILVKKASIQRVKEKYSQVTLMDSLGSSYTFSVEDAIQSNHNRSDAILIAEYCRIINTDLKLF